MPRTAPTHLYLVRHGETDWNREQRLQGTLDVPMNGAGVAQACRLADYFSHVPITHIVSSPLIRATATAAILAEACACPLEIDARLREVDHGIWSGRTLPDIGQEFPSLVRDERLLPEAFAIGRGEQLPDVSRRACEALADLLDAHTGQSVVVVGHGITLAAMWCAATGRDIAQFNECLPPNAGGVVLTFAAREFINAETMAVAEMPA